MASHRSDNLARTSREAEEASLRRLSRLARLYAARYHLPARIAEDFVMEFVEWFWEKGWSVTPAWTPRAYRLDARARLVWIQADDTIHPAAVAAQLWPEERSGP
jgi:hypothetical protein